MDRRRVSEMFGAETIISKDASRSRGMSGSWSGGNRNLLEPGQVRCLNDADAVVMNRGLRPLSFDEARRVRPGHSADVVRGR